MARAVGNYLTSAEAARRLAISKGTLLRALERGEVQVAAQTPGGQYRFLPEDIEAYKLRLAAPASALRRRTPATASQERLVESPTGASREGAAQDLVSDLLALVADNLDARAVVLLEVLGESRHVERAAHDIAREPGARSVFSAAVPLCRTHAATVLADATRLWREAGAPPVTTRVLRDGTVTCVPLYGADGTLFGALCALQAGARAAHETDQAVLRLCGRSVVQAVELAAARAREERLAREVSAQAASLTGIMEHLPCGVVMINTAGAIILMNEEGRRLAGFLENAAQGAQAPSLALLVAPALGGEVLEPRDLIAPAAGDVQETVVRLSAVPLYDVAGQIVGAVAACVDVTERVWLERTLRRSEVHHRRIVETANEGIAQIDPTYRLSAVNPRLAAMLGYRVEDLVGQPVLSVIAEEHHAAALERWARRQRGEIVEYFFDLKMCRKDGAALWTAVCTSIITDDQGHFLSAVAMVSDITARRAVEERLRESEERYRTLVEGHPDGIFLVDPHGRLTFVNPACAAITGYTRDELLALGSFGRLLPHDDQDQALYDWPTLLDAPGQPYERVLRRRDGADVIIEGTLVPLVLDGAVRGVYGVAKDVTAARGAEAALRHRALYDSLTDLPNRSLLEDRLGHALALARREGHCLALILLDLARFAEINDTFGHAQGDALLREVAQRLGQVVRGGETLARLGSDEFAVLLEGVAPPEVRPVAMQVVAALDTPFTVDGYTISLEARAGIALAPEHGSEVALLLRRADVALVWAKRNGARVAMYAPERDPHSPKQLALTGDLREALAAGNFVLHYQPQVHLDTGALAGVEALVRWSHPTRGLLPPGVFIDLVERTGQMGVLTRWVLAEAIGQARAWQSAGLVVPVSVNLSVANLHDPHLREDLVALLGQSGLPPALLRLELTESVLMADIARARDALSGLADLGVGLSIDDFGTGYSSLAYLRHLPFDELKIDRALVQPLVHESTAAMIVASTIGLGHSLGLRVLAEGLEDEDSWRQLRALGCDLGQSYYLGRPQPAEALECWLRAGVGGTLPPTG